MSVIMGNKKLAGSMIGGIAETQEMLDFCAANGITSDVEVIPAAKINEAYERMLKSDVRYRFVIDIGEPRLNARVLRAGDTLVSCAADVVGIAEAGEEPVATMLSTIITRGPRDPSKGASGGC